MACGPFPFLSKVNFSLFYSGKILKNFLFMPCRSDYGDAHNDSGLKTELDKVTRLLCGVCRDYERNYGLPVSALGDVELGRWWEEHKAADAKRVAREKAAEEKEQKKRQALSKLTPEEKKLLGLTKN
jgi:hypothetical protein